MQFITNNSLYFKNFADERELHNIILNSFYNNNEEKERSLKAYKIIHYTCKQQIYATIEAQESAVALDTWEYRIALYIYVQFHIMHHLMHTHNARSK